MQKNSTEFEALRRAGFQKYKERLQREAPHRFWSRVKKGNPDECWPFTGCIWNKYGWVNHNGRNWPAHRYAYLLTFGTFDESLDICHHCDNPPCCNPDHLFAGTPKDNVQDMLKKGRQSKLSMPGEECPNSILKEVQVLEIRSRHANGETQRSLAKIFKVHFSTINLIVLRKNWRHI